MSDIYISYPKTNSICFSQTFTENYSKILLEVQNAMLCIIQSMIRLLFITRNVFTIYIEISCEY